MTTAALPLARPAPSGERREAREPLVRLVECTPFPRARTHQGTRTGYTRNVSDSGLCVTVAFAIREGSLLRVRLRDLGGRPAREGIARVVWSGELTGSRRWIGLELGPCRRRGPASPAA